jgi:hypothetical protein
MTGHTPGPWLDQGTGLILHDGEVIADFVRPEDRPLIAAAPDLLRALKNVDDYFYDSRCTADVLDALLCSIKAAIAKAEGRS